MSNILSWAQAIEQGFEPRNYSYKKEDIPTGTYKANLDFKIWAKADSGITCYFTVAETNQKIILTVYRDRTTKEYLLGNIDFRSVKTNQEHLITTALNSKNNIKFQSISQ